MTYYLNYGKTRYQFHVLIFNDDQTNPILILEESHFKNLIDRYYNMRYNNNKSDIMVIGDFHIGIIEMDIGNHVIIFESGKFSTPKIYLSAIKFEGLIKSFEKQKKENVN